MMTFKEEKPGETTFVEFSSTCTASSRLTADGTAGVSLP